MTNKCLLLTTVTNELDTVTMIDYSKNNCNCCNYKLNLRGNI